MTFYSALLPPAGRPDARAWPVMVACRMSWLVLLCGWGGLLLRGCFISGLLAGGVSILLAQFMPLAFALPVLGGLHLLLALNTPEIRQWELQLRGYAPCRAYMRQTGAPPCCAGWSITGLFLSFSRIMRHTMPAPASSRPGPSW